MNFKMNYENWDNIFAVPKKLVDENFDEVSGVYVKILLLLIRTKGEISTEEIASRFHLNISDVLEALSYWESRGYIASESSGEEKKQVSAPPAKNKAKKTPSVQDISADEIYDKQKNDEVISFLFSSSENLFGRPLTATEARTFIYIYDYIGLPYDVILMVIHHCIQQNKPNCRYMLKMCETWYDLGIDTHEKADAHLKILIQKKDNETLVKKSFGIYDRNLTAKEAKFIETWLNEYNYEINMIRLAYERTIDNIGKLSFPYTNKILSDWHAKGIRTIQQASKEAYKNGNSERKNTNASDTPSYDIDTFDKLGYQIPEIK